MKTHCKVIVASALLAFTSVVLSAQNGFDWKIAELPHIQRTEGTPQTATTPLGNVAVFGGSDAYFLDTNPLKGLDKFTLEIVFKPDGDGRFDQRFLHIGTASGERVMFEIRMNRDSTWYFDTHIAMSDGGRLTMINEKLTHPADRWFHAALVIDGIRAAVYINGVVEFDEPLAFVPVNEGLASIGVRQNLASWFKGSMYRLRITPYPLTKDKFLTDYHALNQ